MPIHLRPKRNLTYGWEWASTVLNGNFNVFTEEGDHVAGVREAAGGKGAARRRSCIGPAGGAGGTSHERGEESPSGPPGDGEEFRVGPLRGPWGDSLGHAPPHGGSASWRDRERRSPKERGPEKGGKLGERAGGAGADLPRGAAVGRPRAEPRRGPRTRVRPPTPRPTQSLPEAPGRLSPRAVAWRPCQSWTAGGAPRRNSLGPLPRPRGFLPAVVAPGGRGLPPLPLTLTLTLTLTHGGDSPAFNKGV